MTFRKVVQIAALLLFLVGLPLGSWYYLKKGFEYQVAARKELKDHGKIGSFHFQTIDGRSFGKSDLEGKVVVASFFSQMNDSLHAVFGQYLNKLHEQFDERKDLVLLQHVLDTAAGTSEKWTGFASAHQLTDTAQCYFLTAGFAEMEQHARQNFHLPAEEEISPAGMPYFILADTAMTIRRFYDVRKEQEVKRLVEHIALILPRIKERELVFKREREK